MTEEDLYDESVLVPSIMTVLCSACGPLGVSVAQQGVCGGHATNGNPG